MPRYFFHFTDGRRTFTDVAGVELSGVAAMRQYAAEEIRRLRSAMPDVKVQNWLDWKIIAVDSVGNTVYEVGFDFTPLNSPELRQRNLAHSPRPTRHE
ncbi:MAG: hypothetical protein WB522_07650 [Pseudolabrys sp.]|jgi:hypothetical protein